MRRATWLLALLIALLSAAACGATGKSGGSGTTAGVTATSTATGSAPQTTPEGATPARGNPPGVPDPDSRMLLGAYVKLSGQSSSMASIRPSWRAGARR